MHRRTFLKQSVLGCFTLGVGNRFTFTRKSHILTLSFDDGFKKSFYRIADIFEKHGLRACLNVIASGHLSTFKSPDKYQVVPRGDFEDWNTLQRRGHEVMPHSWDHTNLTQIPLEHAKMDVVKCLDYFEKHLEGFKTSDSIYNFAFNASTPELEEFVLTKVKAIRTNGTSAVNLIPTSSKPMRVGCKSYGPDNADHWVEQQVNDFIKSEGGWMVLNLHGLNEEGWGPISSTYLDDLLKRMMKLDFLEVRPAAEVMKVK